MDPLLLAVVFVFLASFLLNISPFVGAPYTLLATLQLTLLGFSLLNFAFVVLISAIGATVAKVVVYYGGLGFKGFLVRNRNVRLMGKYSSTQGFYLILFVAALIPLFPFDDLIYVGAGATSASLGLMVSVTLWAKVIKSLVEIALEFTIFRGLATAFRNNQVELTIVLTAAFLMIGVLAFSVDWESGLKRIGVLPPA